jgi:hypothetical protein
MNRIQNVTSEGIYYLDENGATQFVEFEKYQAIIP